MKISKIFIIVAALATPSFVSAQDLMAREANTDFKLKSSNTAKIIEQYQKKEEVIMTSNIYGDVWSNSGVNIYREIAKPEEFVIDLRGFSMPIKNRQVTSNYGYRARFRRNHYGIDIKGYIGDTIYAAFSGKVRIRKYEARGFGKYIVIRHNNGLETIYGHLSKQLVSENEDVKSGQPIGLCGNTGRSYGSHLHFETRVLGEAINPALLFDFQEQDVTADTYTFHPNGGKKMPVATPINSYAQANQAANATGESDEEIDNEDGRKYVASSKRTRRHKVRSGENPSVIAKKYRISVAELKRLNKGMNPNKLRPGQMLIVKK